MLKKIGRFRILEELASDALTKVYAARAEGAESDVRLRVGKLPTPLTPEERARFGVDAATAGSLDTPHIDPVLEHDIQHGMPFVSHPAGQHLSLQTVLDAAGGSLEAGLVARIGLDLARGLACAHRAEPPLVHGGLSPETVLVDSEARALLSGHGLVRACVAATSRHPQLQKLGGAYRAPEQLAGESAGPDADVFSLAALMHRAWSGASPAPGALAGAKIDPTRFEAEASADLTSETAQKTKIDTGAALAKVLEAALAKAPEQRGTAQALVDQLARVIPDEAASRRALADRLGIGLPEVSAPVDEAADGPAAAPALGAPLASVTAATALPERRLPAHEPATDPAEAALFEDVETLAGPPPDAAGDTVPPPSHLGDTEMISLPGARGVVNDATVVDPGISEEALLALDDEDADEPPPSTSVERTVSIETPEAAGHSRNHPALLEAPRVSLPERPSAGAPPPAKLFDEAPPKDPIGAARLWIETQSKRTVGGWPLPWLIGMGGGAMLIILVAALLGVWIAS